jgi:hypothetical protein
LKYVFGNKKLSIWIAQGILQYKLVYKGCCVLLHSFPFLFRGTDNMALARGILDLEHWLRGILDLEHWLGAYLILSTGQGHT